MKLQHATSGTIGLSRSDTPLPRLAPKTVIRWAEVVNGIGDPIQRVTLILSNSQTQSSTSISLGALTPIAFADVEMGSNYSVSVDAFEVWFEWNGQTVKTDKKTEPYPM